jgi:hypothetical protein
MRLFHRSPESGIYLDRLTSTNSWQETRCAVVGSRVVRSDVADSFSAMVMFKGEYELRYTVGGREYSLWVDSGWADTSHQFVETKLESLPEYCAFDIRYNPRKPSQAIATRK